MALCPTVHNTRTRKRLANQHRLLRHLLKSNAAAHVSHVGLRRQGYISNSNLQHSADDHDHQKIPVLKQHSMHLITWKKGVVYTPTRTMQVGCKAV